MKQVKPYLFWIITSIILIAELAWVFIDKPSSRLISDEDVTPVDTKTQVDRQAGELKKLVTRANRTVAVEGARLPEQPIAPEVEAQLKALVGDYIPHNSWVADIDELSEQLTSQGQVIKTDLEARTEFLHQSLTGESGTGWFDEYKLVTRELVRKSMNAGLYGEGEEPDDIQLEESDQYRRQLDLYSGQNGPPSNRQPLLSVNFRLAELIVDTILGAKAVVLANPLYVDQVVVEGEDPKTFDAAPVGPKPAAYNLESIVFSQPIKMKGGAVWRPFTVTIEGDPASVLGVGAALDGMHLEGGPIVVRMSSRMQRLQVSDRSANPLYDSSRMTVQYTTVGVLIDYHQATK